VRAGDLVKVYRRSSSEFQIGVVTGPPLGYYVPVQIGNVNDLYNIERVKVISEGR
jgi:predicted Mrr-cat superfamily restriction endonuclease